MHLLLKLYNIFLRAQRYVCKITMYFNRTQKRLNKLGGINIQHFLLYHFRIGIFKHEKVLLLLRMGENSPVIVINLKYHTLPNFG